MEVSSFIKATPCLELLLARMHNEVKIRVTNEISKLNVALCHLTDSVHDSGHDIPDPLEPSLAVCNYNESCVRWSHNIDN